jgi:hypothetical protein
MTELPALDSRFKDVLDQQVETIRGTLDEMHIQLRQLVTKSSSVKNSTDYTQGIINLTHALTIMDNHLCQIISAHYGAQELEIAAKQRVVNFGEYLRGIRDGKIKN